jgi:hypothetical protein
MSTYVNNARQFHHIQFVIPIIFPECLLDDKSFLIKYNIYIVAAFYNFINFENILTLKQSLYNVVHTVIMHNKVTYVRNR